MVKERNNAQRFKHGIKKGNSSDNPDRVIAKGGHNMRDKATINRIQMYKNFKPIRDRHGKIVKAAPFQSWNASGTVARVDPNRRWFGNTRVITQNALQKFQDEMKNVSDDPYKVIMNPTRLPITLLNEKAKNERLHILEVDTYENTFGPKAQRKKPTLATCDMSEFAAKANERLDTYDEAKDSNVVRDTGGVSNEARYALFKAGQSKRIWKELYKVVDSSDVIIQVLDARDPDGTRCKQVEQMLKKEKKHKHLMFVLNKCDLVPTWITQRWVALLSQEYPTLAFHASLTNPFGKGALIQLLRQFGKLHQDRKQISVGFIGYPNVGKSSVINALRKKKVCKVAPIAGETKVWQYITLMKRIYLIDCPGIVYPQGDTDADIVLKGVVRVENVPNPEDYVEELLKRVKKEYIQRSYGIADWSDHCEFLEKLAIKAGKLLKGGDACLSSAAKMVLNDFQRGKLPYFVKPPGCTDEPVDGDVKIQDLTKRDPSEDSETKAKVDANTGVEEKDEVDADEYSEEKKTKVVKKKAKNTKKETVKKPKASPKSRRNDDVVDGISLKKKKMKRLVKSSNKK